MERTGHDGEGDGQSRFSRRARPRGIVRLVLRLPLLLHRWGLGWLLGERFLVVVHRGTRTGFLRETALEVVHHDPASDEWIVISAWGRRADWLRNIQAQPALEVRAGRRRFFPVQRILTAEEATAALRAYRQRHPRTLRLLARVFGWEYDGSDRALRALAEEKPMVAFRGDG